VLDTITRLTDETVALFDRASRYRWSFRHGCDSRLTAKSLHRV
jgi:hypothetical protein